MFVEWMVITSIFQEVFAVFGVCVQFLIVTHQRMLEDCALEMCYNIG